MITTEEEDLSWWADTCAGFESRTHFQIGPFSVELRQDGAVGVHHWRSYDGSVVLATTAWLVDGLRWWVRRFRPTEPVAQKIEGVILRHHARCVGDVEATLVTRSSSRATIEIKVNGASVGALDLMPTWSSGWIVREMSDSLSSWCDAQLHPESTRAFVGRLAVESHWRDYYGPLT